MVISSTSGISIQFLIQKFNMYTKNNDKVIISWQNLILLPVTLSRWSVLFQEKLAAVIWINVNVEMLPEQSVCFYKLLIIY